MRTVYNKLVRDKIPEIIESEGKIATVRKAEDKEYKLILQEKLVEEVNEFLENGNYKELADVIEVIIALCDINGISFDELLSVVEGKSKARGGFRDRIILISVDE